jgi:large subunit ribosomal protein L1
MAKLTKKQKEALSKYDPSQVYSLEAASSLVKEITMTKFDASVDVDVRLGVDPRKADQMVRGVVALPHGTGKDIKVLVLCTPIPNCAMLITLTAVEGSSPLPVIGVVQFSLI